MSEETKEIIAAAPTKDIVLGTNIFSGFQEFQVAQKMAMALASSTIVPKDYQSNVGNCIIALEMANRLNTSPMMVMQNLYIVNGRPAWSSQYIVAMINASRKYQTELQYDLQGKGDNMSCCAWAMDANGHKVVGPTITMQMAKEEGWLSRNGSKWKTMPEVMIRYRAASFFGRLNCPDMIMGIYTTDEVVELGPDSYRDVDPAEQVKQEIKENANQTPLDIKANAETGEIQEDTAPKEDPFPQDPPSQMPKENNPSKKAADPKPAKSDPAAYIPAF